MLDLEFAHLLNELLQKYPPKQHLPIISEMINMETNQEKINHLKQFFYLKLMEKRANLIDSFLERTKLPIGKMNKELDS